MRRAKFSWFILIVLGTAANDPVWARGGMAGGHSGGHFSGVHPGGRGGWGGHHRGFGYGAYGLGLGLGWGYGGYGLYGPGYGYGFPYYSYPRVVSVPAEPPVYIEQEQTQSPVQAASTLEPNYWYYCRSAEGYYPTVQVCPNGWIQVAPQPAAQSPVQ
jgi:hypothetical protein